MKLAWRASSKWPRRKASSRRRNIRMPWRESMCGGRCWRTPLHTAILTPFVMLRTFIGSAR